MKNKMLWIGSVLILILSVICFVVFGVGTEIIRAITGDGARISFGKYEGKDIILEPKTEFANAINNFTVTAQENKKNTDHPELDQSDYFYIYNYAFNSAVQSAAYKSAVKKSGYKPAPMTISTAMLPMFLNEDGKYDSRNYNSLSNSDREALKTEISTILTWKRFNNDMFGGTNNFGNIIACLSDYRTAFYIDYTEKLGKNSLYGLKSSDKETAFLSSLNSEKRAFTAAAFSKEDYPEEEIKNFASGNQALFNAYSLSAITVKDESQAKKLYSQLTNNEISFKDAITEYSEKYYTNGDGILKQNYEYQIKETLENQDDFSKISSLSKDSVSEVIKTLKGYSIFQCTGDKLTTDINDKETLDAVKNYITLNKQDLIESYFTEKAKKLSAEVKLSGFEKACASYNIEAVSIPAFPLNYGNVSIADPFDTTVSAAFAQAATNEDFLTKAFSMKVEEISEPLVIGNYIVVLQLNEIITDNAEKTAESTIAEKIADYDITEAQSALLSSSKVENNVADTYFNKFMQK